MLGMLGSIPAPSFESLEVLKFGIGGGDMLS